MKPTSQASDAEPRFAARPAPTRFEFAAPIEVTIPLEKTHISGQITEIGRHGCFAEVENLLPMNSFVQLRVHKGGDVFETWARVVYSRAGIGVGLRFVDTAPDQRKVLEDWLAYTAKQR